MYFNLFSSCRLLFPARLPFSQLSLRGFDPLEKVEEQLTQYERRIDDLEKSYDGLSEKQDQHWQDLHKEKLLILKALEQLREKELLLLRNKAPHSSTPARGTLRVFVLPLCFSSCYFPFSKSLLSTPHLKSLVLP